MRKEFSPLAVPKLSQWLLSLKAQLRSTTLLKNFVSKLFLILWEDKYNL